MINKKFTPRYTKVKQQSNKEQKILRAARENRYIYFNGITRQTAKLSTATVETKKMMQYYF